jgi:anti-sigma regulatory factor (Ser/Thr protein kinase)/PAS domain-containing protein
MHRSQAELPSRPVCSGGNQTSKDRFLGRENLQTLVVDSSNAARQQLVEQFRARSGEVHSVARVSAARKYLETGSVDLLIVYEKAAQRDELLDFADNSGLLIRLLFRSKHDATRLYHVRARFGSHKWSFQLHERYRKLLNRIADGVVEVDAHDFIRWANASLIKALGEAQLTGLKLEQIVKPSDVPQLRMIRQQQSAGVVVPFPVRLANGQLVEIDPTLRFGTNGVPLGSTIVFRGVRTAAESDRTRELFALYSVATALSRASNMNEALSTVLQRILELVDLAGAGVHLLRGERQFRRGISLGPELEEILHRYSQQLAVNCKVLVFRNLANHDEPDLATLFSHGIRGLAVLPLEVQGEFFGSMWFVSTDPGHFSREVVSLLISISVQMVVALENSRHVEDRLHEEAERRQFYRNALQAVTGGKLILCEADELERVWRDSGESLGFRSITTNADIPEVRHFVEDCIREAGFSEERSHDMALCATEACGNVVKHAKSGRLEIRFADESLRMRIEDRGAGIHFTNLPSAVLTAGYSTAPSLGMGYSILLELCDSVHLCTSEQGTCLLLEVSRKAVDPLAAFVGLDLL